MGGSCWGIYTGGAVSVGTGSSGIGGS